MNLPFFSKKTKNIVKLSNVYDLVESMIGLNYPDSVKHYSFLDYQLAKTMIRPISDAINKIADHAIGIEPKVWDKIKNVYVELPDFNKLISPPNSFFDYVLFIKTLVINYLTFGNAYYIISYVSNSPISLLNVSSKDVSIESNLNDEFPDKYRLQPHNIIFNRSVENGQIIFKDNLERRIIHIRDASIKDDWRLKGESKIHAIMADTDLYRAVYVFNQSLLDKQGTPSGLFKLQDNAGISDEQRNSLTEQFASQHAGAKNAGKNMILPPGLDYEQTSLSPKDIEYGNILDVVTKGVYNTFNIPLSLIESTALSLANMEVAMSHFYINAVMPTVKTLFSSFTKELMPYFAKDWQNFVVTYDEREISALRGIQLDDITKEASLNVLTLNETRAALNREPVSGGDEVFAPSDLIPISDGGGGDDFIDRDGDGNDPE